MSIIQLRGTSGAGKTTALMAFMENRDLWTPVHPDYFDNRRKASYCVRDNVGILGHCEEQNGGLDSFRGYDKVHKMIDDLLSQGYEHIIMEGLILSDDWKQTVEMSKRQEVKILYLTTPAEVCLDRVKDRRELKGKDREDFNQNRIIERHTRIERSRQKLIDLIPPYNPIHCYRQHGNQIAKTLNRMVGWT